MAAASKPTKNQLRRAKKKAAKHNEVWCPHTVKISFIYRLSQSNSVQRLEPAGGLESATPIAEPTLPADEEQDGIPNGIDGIDETNPLYEMYKNIMSRFEQNGTEDLSTKEVEKPEIYYDDDDEIPDEEEEAGQAKMSKKRRKERDKLSVAELKALVEKPETVDWTDTSASDPRLLVHIKAYRNVVPVPSHWSLKREYLSSKRGVEKPPFALPKFIQETGIAEMRDAVLEKQDQASLKQKQR